MSDSEDDSEDPMQSTYDHLLSTGKATPSQVLRMRTERRHKEAHQLARRLLLDRAYLRDGTVGSRTDLLLRAGAALDGLGRRDEAVFLLRNYRFLDEVVYSSDEENEGSHTGVLVELGAVDGNAVRVALAKILFKQDMKAEALSLCLSVASSSSSDPSAVRVSDAVDSYYLAGWISIHDDDHSKAYRTWKRGGDELPCSEVLGRQNGKRECWDGAGRGEEELEEGLVGAAPVPGSDNLQPFAVPEGALEEEMGKDRRIVVSFFVGRTAMAWGQRWLFVPSLSSPPALFQPLCSFAYALIRI